MALDLFAAEPGLLPLAEVLEAHHDLGLVLAVPAADDRGPRQLVLKGGAAPYGRPLLTELLRLASVGHLALQGVARSPELTLAEFGRKARTGDADLLVYLEGR